MISQSVLYTPYPKNPNAAQGIIELALRYVSDVPGTELRVGPAVESSRAVVISNDCVVKTTTWKNADDQAAYFKHPGLIKYVEEVLKGWKLSGDPDGSSEAFITDILGPNPSGRAWVRDESVPDEQVVWGGEKIMLYEWES